DGTVAAASAPKEMREFGGRTYVLEHGIVTDFALVHAAAGDRQGNLVFSKAARNFNPICAMAGRVAIAEVETLLRPGEIAPGDVDLPGIFVKRVVPLTTVDKPIEKRTVRDTRVGGR
ncbi:MAG: CoA-transferase, partial [Acidimicrobiales bacterium]